MGLTSRTRRMHAQLLWRPQQLSKLAHLSYSMMQKSTQVATSARDHVQPVTVGKNFTGLNAQWMVAHTHWMVAHNCNLVPMMEMMGNVADMVGIVVAGILDMDIDDGHGYGGYVLHV